MQWKQAVISAFAVAVLSGTLIGCEREGPAERAGESVDETVERAGEEVEGATER
jgi:predicted small lipoprotein YifL